MKNFRVTVNGVAYDVAVEEVAPGTAPAPIAPIAPAPVLAPVAPAPAPVSAAPAAPVSANAYKLTAPMTGTIADIKVSVGEMVQKDQVGVILEAMKMENEVFIPVSGKVTSINVAKGASVNADDVLLTVE